MRSRHLKRILLSLTILVHVYNAISQTAIPIKCGDDLLRNLARQTIPGYDKIQEQKDLVLKEYAANMLRGRHQPASRGNTLAEADSVYTIPVVVHVVFPTGEPYGTGTNISYGQIRSQIQALNAAFGKTYPAYNGQSHPAYAQDTRIRFCLASNTGDTANWASGPGGTEFGVKRYADASGASNHNITSASANQLLAITHPVATRFPFTKYLNIWLVKTIGGGNNIMGYAPRPIMSGYPLDGVVMRADIFGDNTTGGGHPLNNLFGLTQGKVLAHEVGHYLNLYHIFQGGCAGANAAGAATDACDLNGDMICDIEPANTQNIFCGVSIPNTCTANYNTGTTNLDMINDYMSYADDDCMNTFTLDQSKRMWSTLNIDRFTIWQPENLAATGVLGPNGCVPSFLNAQINTNDAVFCAGKVITFSNPTVGNTATSYLWQFPGGSIASATTNTVKVSYATSGNYKAILKVSNASGYTRTDSLLFTVLDCKLDSSMLHMSHWYFGHFGSIDFSSGAPVQTNVAMAKNTIQRELSDSMLGPAIQGTVSLSDSLGNLLFYSNAVSVWNKNHQKISTEPIFGKSDINASTGVCYVPYPGKPGKYFIAGASSNLYVMPEGVKFVEVDLNTNTVTPFKEFRHSSLPAKLSQFLTVVPHCNGTDYWIIAHGYDADVQFYSFLVTASGIDPIQAPVISQGSHKAYQGSGNQLKANRQADKLILCTPHGFGAPAASIYDFDSRTGQVKNERMVPHVSGYNNIQTGAAFSPNGEYFYLMRSSNLVTNGLPYWLFQYRVSDFQFNIFNAPGFYFAAPFQPGPDNQIYITTQDNYFARLSNPDKWGGASVNGSFIRMTDLHQSINTGVSIPGFIDAKRPVPTHPDFTAKAITCNSFRFSALCFDNYTATWNFGDGSALQTGNSITHLYAQPGEYTVTMRLSQGTIVFGTATKKVTVLALTTSISGPDYICSNGTHPSQYFSPVLPGVSYKWTAVNGSIIGPDNFPFVDVLWFPAVSAGTVELVISRDSCVFPVSKTVGISHGPAFNWILKDSVCVYDSAFALAATPVGGVFNGPGVSNNRFSPAAAGLGIHTIVYTYSDELTCLGQVQKTLKVSNCNIPTTPNTSCDTLLNTILVAPNPVSGVLQLKSPYVLKFVQVFNSIGQKVAEGQLTSNSLRLPVLAGGIYTVLVYCEQNNKFRSLKFMKQD
ncbi:MAG: PKD domain-containing protein [Bacteroidota bacterium]